MGETDAAELMTVGQRRGVATDRNGEKRYVASVNVRERRIEVGTLDEVLISRMALDESSLSFTHDEVSATVKWCSLNGVRTGAFRSRRFVRDEPVRLSFHAPARPVAPGQTVVMYQLQEPTIVAGAAIVLRS